MSHRFSLLFLLLALVLVGCDLSDEADPTPVPFQNIAEIVQDGQRFTTLELALSAAGLTDALAGGEFTLFAPDDAAFSALAAATGGITDSLLATNEDGSLVRGDALSALLTYHVVPGRFESTSLSDGQTLTTLQGAQLTVRIVDGTVYVGGAPVTTTDTPATNGIVHSVGQVLTGTLDIVTFAALSPNFTALVEQLGEAELIEALGGSPLTVFAPTNAAAAATAAFTDLEEARQTDVLLYHVVGGQATDVFDVSGSASLTTLDGEALTVSVDEDGAATVNAGVNVVASYTVSNGVVHAIDQVLLGALNVVERAVLTPDLSTLTGAVVSTELDGALSGEGPFTVFAPTNAAFETVQTGDAEGFLDQILLYHVVPGEFRAADFSDGQTLETLAGESLTVSVNEGGVFVDGIPVATANVPVENGVIHLVGSVLLEGLNVVERAIVTPGLDELVAAVVASDLVDALATTPNITVFAPTDEAFAAAREALGDDFPEGDALTDVLLYHVVPAQNGAPVEAGDITDGLSVPTLLDGATITFGISGNDVLVNPGDGGAQAEVAIPNVRTTNGIVHVIDGVLLP